MQMRTSNLIKNSIENNLPMLITGNSGTGKSSLVAHVAEKLGYELVDIRAAGILPEDIGGLPRANGNSYDYLMPKWFSDRLDKPFVLFLDEINQASIQVLHALYGVILDRMVAGVKNPQMRVIAACNDFTENEYVTDLMLPLRKRFIIDIKHTPDNMEVKKHLMTKYSKFEKIIDLVHRSGKKIPPRDLEFGIQVLDSGVIDFDVLKKHFQELTENVLSEYSIIQNMKCEDIKDSQIQSAVNAINQGSVMFNNISIPVNKEHILNTVDEESRETVKILTGME